MLGELPQRPPAPLWDSGAVTSGTARADIDVTGLTSIRLLTVDVDSYDPQRVRVGWLEPRLVKGTTGDGFPAVPPNGEIQLKDAAAASSAFIVPKLPHEVMVNLNGATRFRAAVGADASTVVSDIGPKVRFFVFKGDARPESKSLPGVVGGPPVESAQPVASKNRADTLVTSLFRRAYSREPAAKEREIALRMLGNPVSSAGLEDLLWTLVLSPEFQYGR